MPPEVLLLTGAAGVGKSTVSWEVSEELKRRGLAHAVIDTDGVDVNTVAVQLCDLMRWRG